MQVRYILDHVNHDALVGVGESGVGPWRAMAGAPGWTSAARYRLVPLGLQLAGSMSGPLEVNTPRHIGTLPPDAQPVETQVAPVAITAGNIATTGVLIVYPDNGEVFYWAAVGGNGVIYLSTVFSLD